MKKTYFIFLLLFCFAACKKEPVSEAHKLSNKGETVTYNLKNGGKVTVFVNNKGEHIVGGDVILSTEQIAFLNANRIGSVAGPTTESTFTDEFQKLWPNGIVYYVINDASNSTTINNAIAHWQANTPIRFIQRTNQSNYVNFSGQPDQGAGDSQLGMVGGVQAIRLVTAASLRTVIHEIGHAVGLMHEQTRNDRDTYVNINYSNINKDWKYQYDTYDIQGRGGYQTGPFDFESVMLYPSFTSEAAYPGNTTPQITKKDGSGYGYNFYGTLSQGDVKGVNYLYKPSVYVKQVVTLDPANSYYNYDPMGDDAHQEYFNSVEFYSDANFTIPITTPYKIKLKHNYTYEGYQNSYTVQQKEIEIPQGTSSFALGTSIDEFRMDYGNYISWFRSSYNLQTGVGYRK